MKLLFKIILWAIIVFCGLILFVGIGDSIENGFDIYAIILILIFAGIIALCWRGITKLKCNKPTNKVQKSKKSQHPKIEKSYGIDPFKSKRNLKKFVTLAIEGGYFSEQDQETTEKALNKFNLEPNFVEPILTKKFKQRTYYIVNEVMKTKLLTDEQWEQVKKISTDLGITYCDMDDEMSAYHDNWLAFQNKPVDIFEGTQSEGFIRETKHKTEWRDVKETEVSMTYTNLKGTTSERKVLIRQISEHGGFKALCLERQAIRNFKIDSVDELIDISTGEILSNHRDIKAYFERLLK